MARPNCFLAWTVFSITFRNNCVASISSQHHSRNAHPPLTTVLTIHGGGNITSHSLYTETTTFSHSKSPQRSSSVTFLYELHEHEIYNPTTDSWTSRRFTQSPLTGGGGRDSTSLNPTSCSPPRNYLWDGEWKIDMSGGMKDGFGWEYYVGRYDGLGRRRRRWVRNLRRIGSSDIVKKAEKKNVTKTSSILDEKKISPTLLQTIINQYSFKGFGWSFYKSLIWKRSFGAAFRIPLSTNFEFFDRYAAIPFVSSSTYFGYPWVIATFLNASVPLDVIEWILGGILWKIQWSIAVASALARSVVEAVVWFVMTPWRTWCTFRQIMRKYVSKNGMARSLMDSIDADSEEEEDEVTKPMKNVTKHGKIDTLIEMSTTSTTNEEIGELSALSTTAVVGSPRGGASLPKRQFLTIFGQPIPTFHRTTNIQYSSVLSRRVGVCMSWRMSRERGYEHRWNFFLSCLPTQEFWEGIDRVARRKFDTFRRIGSKSVEEGSGSALQQQSSAIQSFLYHHSGTLGVSSGFPLPVDPFFSCSVLLSLSGFYYGWLLKYIASILCLHRDKPKFGEEATAPRDDIKTDGSSSVDVIPATGAVVTS